MSSQNKIKLLLVDDEIDFLQAITERLTLKDFDVIAASTGREAIAAAENDLFDVAVVDFQMPGMDGTQVMKALKDRHRYLGSSC
jgi:CheY-like chemotaxis protein